MKKQKKFNWKRLLSAVITIMGGAVCGFFIGALADEAIGEKANPEGILYLVILFIGLMAAMYLQTIIHEAGHLVCGLISGYHFSSFRIGSVILVKESGKWKLKRLSIPGTGGQCLMAPPDLVDGKIPVLLYNLGGSLFNLAVSLVCIAVYLVSDRKSGFAVFMVMMAAFGILGGFLNGIPMRMGTVDNDGYNARALCKSKAALRAFWMQMKVNEQISKGVRLKDMPAEWFAVPTDEEMKNSLAASAGVFACNRLMDIKAFDEAVELMDHLLEIESGMVGLHRNLMICDRICCELLADNREERLTELYSSQQKQFMKSMKSFPTVLRTEYMYAKIFEKDLQKAEKIRKQFEKAGRKYPYPNEINAERELMELTDVICA